MRQRGTCWWLGGLMTATALLAPPWQLPFHGGTIAIISTASAAETAPPVNVRVRTGAHKGYGRMVFDWPSQVGYEAAIEGNQLVIRFERPINAALDRTVSGLPAYLSGATVADAGRTVRFDLKQPVSLKTFRNGNAVALDLTPAATAIATSAAPDQPAPPAKAKAPVGGRVTVRASETPQGSKLDLTWPKAVDYTLQRDGSSVTLRFDHAGTANLAPVTRAGLKNLSKVEQYALPDGALAITFAVPPNARISESRSGRALSITVGDRLVADSTPASTPAVQANPAPATPPAVPAGQQERPAVQSPASPPATATQPAASQPAVSPAAAPTMVPAPVPAVQQAKPDQPAASGPTLVFDAQGPASIAVFPRAGHLYIVFDKTLPISAGKMLGPAEGMGRIEPVPATGGTAFRTRIGQMIWPVIERQGTSWRISPGSSLHASTSRDLRIDPEPDFLLGARLIVRAPDAATVVQLADPDVGDRLQVVPLPAPGNAIMSGRRYADLELLPTYQGVVVRPVSEAVAVRPVREGIELTSAGGLHLSPQSDVAALLPPPEIAPAAPAAVSQGGRSPSDTVPQVANMLRPDHRPAAQNKRLFKLNEWTRGGPENYTVARQELQEAIINTPEMERASAVLDFARFYFAQGMGQEGLGVLEVLLASQPDFEGWPEFTALRGALRVLANDLEGAAVDLGHPFLENNVEAGLWRAAAAALRGDWAKAHQDFRAASNILHSYPEPHLSRLALLAGEAALEQDDLGFAKRALDRVVERGGEEAEERADLLYLRGQLAARNAENLPAIEDLRRAYNSLDRLYHAKAGLALVDLEMAQGSMSPAAAAEILAGLTFTWRGDDLELPIRQRLGQVLISGASYADGFNTMKETAALAGDSPRAEAITREMGQIFGDLFKDGGQRLPTLDALALYDQFRELTPLGAEGDEIIRQLAERLISIDLLGRAADLLQHQVEYRLSGTEKVQTGTRLASVRLLDNKPELAIKALELSNIQNLPADLVHERRLMHAKALAELGKGSEAVALLGLDDSKAANLLRVDIAWRNQNWDGAAFALGKLIGDPPADNHLLEPEVSQLVLNRAVALALSGDGTALSLLRKDFGPAMESGPDGEAFRVLTRAEQALGLLDVNTIRNRVAEVDLFKDFLRNYRTRAASPANS